MRLEGLRELRAALAELPKATGKNVLRRALMNAGEPIEQAAAAAAPVLRGHLQRSVTTGQKLTRRQKAKHRKESEVEVFVGAGGLAQAIQQEFGNVNHAAQPFLRPAWDANKVAVAKAIAGELAQEIEKTRARLAHKAARLAAAMK
jgi:HK97 gp10 family phage protein